MSEFDRRHLKKIDRLSDSVLQQKSKKTRSHSPDHHNSGVNPSPDILLNASADDQAKLLRDIQSDSQRVAMAVRLQQAYGNAYVQSVFDRISAKKQAEELQVAEIQPYGSNKATAGEPIPALRAEAEASEKEKRQSVPEEGAKVGRIRSGWSFINIGDVVDDPINPQPQANCAGSTGYFIDTQGKVYSELTPALGVGEEVWTESEFFKVQITDLKIHIKIAIWPSDNYRFSAIEEFGYYYQGPFDYRFRTHEGVEKHENEHRKQIVRIWEQRYPEFVTKVRSISESNEVDAEQEYRKLKGELKENVEADWLEQGTEEEPERVEWEFYHTQYRALLNSPTESVSGPQEPGE